MRTVRNYYDLSIAHVSTVLFVFWFVLPIQVDACTIGVANGFVTMDNRPILWRSHDGEEGSSHHLEYVSASPYSYLTVYTSYPFMGLNEAGVASVNSYVAPCNSCDNSTIQTHVMENFDSLDEIRDYIQSSVDAGTCNATGCFPFIDANGNASLFEISYSDWFLEYNPMDPDRIAQDLYGFVIRANEFHNHSDGTDNTSITGRYQTGTYNTSGLVNINGLSVSTIIQGDNGSNGFEFLRYGPGRPLDAISRPITSHATVTQGVAPGEDPALTTMWVILGQSNYGIAVPAWVKVSNIPSCLANGDMYNRARSLYNKGNEATTQASTFPVEAHILNIVNNELLPHWRTNGVPSVAEMTRIEHQMANDAYSLLNCLDNTQSNNKAPQITLDAYPDGLTLYFELTASDADGTIDSVEWDFGDDQNSTQAYPTHTYDQEGTYLVSCTVTDDDGVSITDWEYYVVPSTATVARGDLEPDGDVDFVDFSALALAWLTTPGEPNWNPVCDISNPNDDVIDGLDLAVFANDWLSEREILVAWWKFDEGSGTTAYDSAGSNDGTISEAVWTSGKIGGALSFDGVNDYVSCPNDVSLNVPAGLTISAWVYMNATGVYPAVVTKGAGANDWGYCLQFKSDTRKIDLFLENANESWVNSAKTPVPLGQWTHIAAVYNGVDVLQYYFNGTPDGIYTVTGGSIKSNSANLLIGKRIDGFVLNGKVDDVRIYNEVLSSKDVLKIYEGGL